MFHKILIANRGEIACRIIRTARRLGIRTVAVYSDADSGARHVALADEAVRIGEAAARSSYLRGDRILDAARQTGAGAIHPGYGFLSENADFAKACADAGIVFVGPPEGAIRAMGSKSAAKAIMGKAGVPLVPGYHGDEQDAGFLAGEADRIGYPVLIKASAGGGGKGMRLVEDKAAFRDALASCRREAASGFGDDHVLIERYVTRPRHIEMQVFADQAGNVIHLFERDCSLQRRHQKVIEESPAPLFAPEMRTEMGRAACDAARAIGYVGAGTVEFIAESAEDGTPQDFFFMEMNTRLQVEHPVTEMVTGLDLVEWQFRVAAGEALPLTQEQVAIGGHAVEARLYAEDAQAGFLPATGRLDRFHLPEETAGIRIDAGVAEGDRITIDYDPMIAKVIAHGPDRAAALRRLAGALGAVRVAGVTTNRDFLIRLVRDRDVADGRVDTGLIDHKRGALVEQERREVHRAVALAAAALFSGREHDRADRAQRRGDPHSPFAHLHGWRLNDDGHDTVELRQGDALMYVEGRRREDGYDLTLDGAVSALRGFRLDAGQASALLDGVKIEATVDRGDGVIRVQSADATIRFEIVDPLAGAGGLDAGAHHLTAPMPGKVTAVHVSAGAAVAKGDALLVLEAMKMEHVIVAPDDGVISDVHFQAGDQVTEGDELVSFAED